MKILKGKAKVSDRSQQADVIIQNKLFQDSFEEMKKECYSKWLASESADEREELHREMKAMASFQTKLEIALSEGVVEQHMVGGDHDG